MDAETKADGDNKPTLGGTQVTEGGETQRGGSVELGMRLPEKDEGHKGALRSSMSSHPCEAKQSTQEPGNTDSMKYQRPVGIRERRKQLQF